MAIEERPKKTRVPETRLMVNSLLLKRVKSIIGDSTFFSVMRNAMRPMRLIANKAKTGKLMKPLV